MIKRIQEDIENSFNSMNLDYIFQYDNILSLQLEEKGSSLLVNLQNFEGLPKVDLNDENVKVDDNDSNFSKTPS